VLDLIAAGEDPYGDGVSERTAFFAHIRRR